MITLTLLEQLNKSPKWTQFEKWYKEQSYVLPLYDSTLFGFRELPFEFQRGVFEKFIEDNSHIQSEFFLWTEKSGNKYFESFEELLIYYFNEI